MDPTGSKPKPKMTEEERTELARKLDEDLDRFMDSLAARKKTESKKPFDFDEWCKDLNQHPAFMAELKPNESGAYSEAVQALQALKYEDGTSVEERIESAENHKEEGNKYFKFKKYRWATDCYTNGIKIMCGDRKLNSVLYANRAAAQKRLLNIRSALGDCVFARKFDPGNKKAIIRGAECLIELGYGQQCLDWIESSTKMLKENADCCANGKDQISEKSFFDCLSELQDSARRLKQVEEKNARRKKFAQAKDLSAKEKLLNAFASRKLQFKPKIVLDDASLFEWCQIEVCIPQIQSHQMVRLDEDGLLHWPLLIQYPEFGHVDFLTDCCEESMLVDVLNPLFQQPAEWDVTQSIRQKNVRYFISLDVYDEDEVQEVFPNETLRSVFSTNDFVIKQGLPVVQMYTKKRAEESFSYVAERRYKVL